MNPNTPLIPRTVRLLALGLIAFSPMVALAADPPPPAAGAAGSGDSAAKPYTLYIGTDFAVEWEGQLRPVQDVRENEFVVSVNGSPAVVRPRNGELKIKGDDVLKVTASNATIADFKAERAYTPANDPRIKYGRASSMAGGASAGADIALRSAMLSQSAAGQSVERAATNTSPDVQAQLDYTAAADSASAASAESAYQSSLSSASRETDLARNLSIRMDAEIAAERFDAIAVTFQISAPRPLTKPYVVVMTRYLERPDDPKSEHIWTYAQALPRVDTKPASFRMMRGGFPPGYKLGEVQVHLYDQGAEIATNLARKRIAITADDAFQFAVVGYIEQHRGATLQPVALRSNLPTNLRQRLASAQLNRCFYVKVGKNGMPAGAFADEACSEKLTDPDLAAAASALRFNPALTEGRPVEAVAPVRLDQLAL